MEKLFFTLGEIKAFAESLPPEKRDEFLTKVTEAKEESLSLSEGKRTAEKELADEKQKGRRDFLNIKSFVALVLFGNFLVFPLINFAVRLFDKDAPQIAFELEKLITLLLPFLRAG